MLLSKEAIFHIFECENNKESLEILNQNCDILIRPRSQGFQPFCVTFFPMYLAIDGDIKTPLLVRSYVIKWYSDAVLSQSAALSLPL